MLPYGFVRVCFLVVFCCVSRKQFFRRFLLFTTNFYRQTFFCHAESICGMGHTETDEGKRYRKYFSKNMYAHTFLSVLLCNASHIILLVNPLLCTFRLFVVWINSSFPTFLLSAYEIWKVLVSLAKKICLLQQNKFRAKNNFLSVRRRCRRLLDEFCIDDKSAALSEI
jgi:hypothetical protein